MTDGKTKVTLALSALALGLVLVFASFGAAAPAGSADLGIAKTDSPDPVGLGSTAAVSTAKLLSGSVEGYTPDAPIWRSGQVLRLHLASLIFLTGNVIERAADVGEAEIWAPYLFFGAQ
ncbi:MAG TPA: hypothetical protein VK889_09940 [Solirubrobacterales bacterium]|nr:hypothetical protein [Solirubrobacterales bacterium]